MDKNIEIMAKALEKIAEIANEAIKLCKIEMSLQDPRELSDEEKEVFDELAKRCFEVALGKKPEEAPVKTADLSTEKEEPKEIIGKEEKQAPKYRYSAYRIKGDK